MKEEFNLLSDYSKTKVKHLWKGIKTINHRIIASHRDKSF